MKLFTPFYFKQTTSIPAQTSDFEMTVPIGEGAVLLKTIEVNAGQNATITKIEIDGYDIEQTAASIDLEAIFGNLIMARASIVLTITSTDASAQDTEVILAGSKEA